MAHECELCGQYCYCDMEDHGQPQPEDCPHLDGACEDEMDDAPGFVDEDCPGCPTDWDDIGGEA
jgi:hypothetical protein